MRLAEKLLTFEEYCALNNDAVERGFWRMDRRILLPGMGWYNNWYLKLDKSKTFLSPHYYRDWADKRPPIELVCPDGNIWCIDRMSSNGNGWIVTGEWPNITCSPSIDCAPMGTAQGDYHGWLQNGEFTPDVSGKTFPIPNIGPDYGRKDV